ncbi:hypothetical protein TRFO_06985 [Tritrichomonas foetus]|uniref:VHS domain-containing protein n=1 Tax=Tritrichomonas foetus TaxID=1144522 RepID=A0A1J4JV51_9EUKA|nr:hypothetical protein TRFO_06985 [Tritrichomonas foetus]|eukprot:OHT02586.1 hypothetical protein TRFO_06985 [Tritrichomonas foetus]
MSDKKYFDLITLIINTDNDSIDWARAMVMIDFLQKRRNHDSAIFKAIGSYMKNGNRQLKLNSLIFIDTLFINGSPSLLTAIQKSASVLGISEKNSPDDPLLHSRMCRMSKKWIEVCKKNRCLKNSFKEWGKKIQSFHFEYVIDRKTAKKISKDLILTYQFLNMFSQTMIAAKFQNCGSNDPMILEMLPSVLEAKARLTELKKTINDKHCISNIKFLENYCDICYQSYINYQKNQNFNEELLIEMAEQGLSRKKSSTPNNSSSASNNGMVYYPTPYSNDHFDNPDQHISDPMQFPSVMALPISFSNPRYELPDLPGASPLGHQSMSSPNFQNELMNAISSPSSSSHSNDELMPYTQNESQMAFQAPLPVSSYTTPIDKHQNSSQGSSSESFNENMPQIPVDFGYPTVPQTFQYPEIPNFGYPTLPNDLPGNMNLNHSISEDSSSYEYEEPGSHYPKLAPQIYPPSAYSRNVTVVTATNDYVPPFQPPPVQGVFA